MIERYTRPEMGAVWTQQAKFQSWLDVELAATDAWAAEGVVNRLPGEGRVHGRGSQRS